MLNAFGISSCNEPAQAATGKKTATCLVGRDRVFWEGLKSILRGSQFDVVCAVDDIAQVLGAPNIATEIGLALRDFASDTADLESEIRHLRSGFPGVRVVAVTEKVSPETLRDCVVGGAHGYLTKDIATDTLVRSLRVVMLGEKVFPTRMAGLLVSGKTKATPTPGSGENPCHLSKREMQIANLVVLGESNKMIASRLVISESTVKGHMNNLLRKTNATNRTQAAIRAVRSS